MRIVVVDFETTGMAPPALVIEDGRCVVERADDAGPWVALQESAKSQFYHAPYNPPETRAINHIRPDMIADRLPFDPNWWAQEMVQLGPVAIAAHNLQFDEQWMGDTPDIYRICTLKAAYRIWPDAPAHNNWALYYWLTDHWPIPQISPTNMALPHRGRGDSAATATILAAMLNLGFSGQQLVGWTKTPRVLPRCPIGKQKGQRWHEIDSGFLEWMLRQHDMDADYKWNAQREIDRRARA